MVKIILILAGGCAAGFALCLYIATRLPDAAVSGGAPY